MDLEMARRNGGDKRLRRCNAAIAARQTLTDALVRDAPKKGNPRTLRAFSHDERLC